MPITNPEKTRAELQAEVEELSRRLEEAEQILSAIQSGAVDAVVVSSPNGEQIFTLQGAEHAYRVMVETMNEGAATLDSAGTILYCNARLAAMLELPLEKLIGTRLSSRLTAEHAGFFAGLLEQDAAVCDKREVELVKEGGEHLPVILSCCSGEYSGSRALTVIITDISARKKAERALKEETVERLRAVEELRQNEQLLIQQSRQAALGEMLGNIAHQWRQPLNTLGLLVQQAPLYYQLGEVDQEYLDKNAKKAMELIDHMSSTIDDFRDFFRPEKEKVSFSVKDEVAKTLSLMEGSFQDRQMDITVEVETQGDPVVQGYPNEFSQVLLNIVMNARDALVEAERGAPRIAIAIGTENDRAVVTVADNAGGIPEGIIAKIFDPYFTTKGPQSGTGVGLFMAKTIIEKKMGGRLSVRNTGGGAEFRIEV